MIRLSLKRLIINALSIRGTKRIGLSARGPAKSRHAKTAFNQ
jgi:hypothetical protein